MTKECIETLGRPIGAEQQGGVMSEKSIQKPDNTQLATAYYLAAQWHDKQAAGCEAMARDEPRLGSDIRARAAENARHHRGSAAGLRLAATQIRRAAIHNNASNMACYAG